MIPRLIPQLTDVGVTVSRCVAFAPSAVGSLQDRIRTLWAARKAEVDWSPGRDAEPVLDDAAEWAETARHFCGLARDAIVADGIDIDPPDEVGTSGNAAETAAVR